MADDWATELIEDHRQRVSNAKVKRWEAEVACTIQRAYERGFNHGWLGARDTTREQIDRVIQERNVVIRQRNALAEALRAIIHAYDNGRASDEFNVPLDQAVELARAALEEEP